MTNPRTPAKTAALIGLTAAAYTAVTYATQFMAYREVQFRLAEMLNLLVFFDPVFAPGVILGCALANVFSPLGPIDVIAGSAATAIACLGIAKSKRLFTASLWPVVANGIAVPLEIMLAEGLPLAAFPPIAASVAAGEFAVVSIAGVAAFKLIARDGRLLERLKRL